MTQTQITFTVPMEDVLKYIRNHLRQEVGASKSTQGILSTAVLSLEEAMRDEGDLRFALIYLDNYRKALAKHDLRVKECMAVLEGYYSQDEQVQGREEFPTPDLQNLQRALDDVQKDMEVDSE